MVLPEKSQGFTLIEILIVVSVVTMITGAFLPSFSNYIKTQSLMQAKEQVKSDIRNVQNRALAGSVSEETLGTPAEKINYWGVQFKNGSGTYDYFTSVDAEACPPSKMSSKGISPALVGGSLLYLPNGNVCIFSSILSGDSPVENTIYISDLNKKACVPIIVNKAGLVASGGITICP